MTEISSSANQAVNGVRVVEETIGHVAEGAKESNASVDEVRTASSGLAQHAETLSEDVEAFVRQVAGG